MDTVLNTVPLLSCTGIDDDDEDARFAFERIFNEQL